MGNHVTRREFGLGFAAAAAAAAVPMRAQAAVSLKHATAAAPGSVTANFAVKLFNTVEKQTDGEVKAQIYAGTLGGEKTLIDGVSLGSLDVYSGAYTGTRECDILYSPHFFRDGAHAGSVMRGSLGERVSKVLEAKYNARLLGVGRLGPYVLALKRKISSIDEIKGMKLRTPEIEGCLAAVRHLGGNPTSVPFNEVYMALQNGVVDGFVSALNPSLGAKFHEVCKYVVGNPFGEGLDKIVISTRAWERLSAKQKEILSGTMRGLEEVEYYKAGLAAMDKDFGAWRAVNGPDSVLTLDAQELAKRMLPLNQKLADDVYGAGSFDLIQRT